MFILNFKLDHFHSNYNVKLNKINKKINFSYNSMRIYNTLQDFKEK